MKMQSNNLFLEAQIYKQLQQLRALSDRIIMLDDNVQTVNPRHATGMNQEIIELKEKYEYRLRVFANDIQVYLEAIHHARYLKKFETELLPKFSSPNEIYNQKYSDVTEELYSPFIEEIGAFLAPFEFSHLAEIDRALSAAGVQYLENILQATGQILNDLGKIPKSEPQIYNTIKFVIKAVFPDSKGAGSNFLKTAKEYKPDVLIPSVKAAVEYKYATSEKKLKTQIGQVLEDQAGYTGDDDYQLFYAVFYVNRDFWGVKKFNEVWRKDFSFPKNWRAYYIIGG